MTFRHCGLLRKDCFGETPKPTRETRALPGGETDLEVYVPTRSERNSERVRASSLKVPSKQDVFMTEFCFSTPRIIMQRCFASTTMPTPAGRSVFINASAICTVRFS